LYPNIRHRDPRALFSGGVFITVGDSSIGYSEVHFRWVNMSSSRPADDDPPETLLLCSQSSACTVELLSEQEDEEVHVHRSSDVAVPKLKRWVLFDIICVLGLFQVTVI
jgi:hypothetical protein